MSNNQNTILRDEVWAEMEEEADKVIESLWENEKLSSDEILQALRKHAPSIFKGVMLECWDIAEGNFGCEIDEAVQEELNARIEAWEQP